MYSVGLWRLNRKSRPLQAHSQIRQGCFYSYFEPQVPTKGHMTICGRLFEGTGLHVKLLCQCFSPHRPLYTQVHHLCLSSLLQQGIRGVICSAFITSLRSQNHRKMETGKDVWRSSCSKRATAQMLRCQKLYSKINWLQLITIFKQEIISGLRLIVLEMQMNTCHSLPHPPPLRPKTGIETGKCLYIFFSFFIHEQHS